MSEHHALPAGRGPLLWPRGSVDWSAEDTLLFALISRAQWTGSREGISCRREGVSVTLINRQSCVLRAALPKQSAVAVFHFIGDWCSVGVYCFAKSTFYGQVTKHILWGGQPSVHTAQPSRANIVCDNS